jgi:3' exoribonuclease, RNase T-like
MKYWLDTEFIEDGETIDLISIGIVAEDGRQYYAINYDCGFDKASQWVQDNVLIYLPFKPLKLNPGYGQSGEFIDTGVWRRRQFIAKDIARFIHDDNVEIWAYYADYDWVVFCQLFGTMMNLPKNFPMYCRDIKQECDRISNPKLPNQESDKHHALNDAIWCKVAWEYLQSII